MLKVVIADDEVRVCRLIQMLADWDALGMEVVGTAENGLQALELIKTLKPDILITDIRMPGCDGLELIEKAKSILPNLEIALISGYAQFEYAQTALRYNVGGYLLKPINKEELTDTLEKLGKKCRVRIASAAAIENMRRDSNKNHILLRDRLIDDLLHKRIALLTPERLNSEYAFTFNEGTLQVYILKIDCKSEDFKSAAFDIVKSKAEEIIELAVYPICYTSVFQFHDSAGYGIFNYASEKCGLIRQTMRQCLNQLEAQKFIFGSFKFSLSQGRPTDTAEELTLSMREAQSAIAERLVEGTGRLHESVMQSSHVDARKILEKYSRKIEHVLDTMNIQEAEEAVNVLVEELEKIDSVRGYELLDLIFGAGKMFAVRANLEDEGASINDFERFCQLCASTGELFDCLRDFQRKQIDAILLRRESEAIRPIRIAKQYIQQHFSEPITLEDVCDATGFSASYFSTLFKKETGEGFSKYLTRVRIDKAKALLQDTNLPITEICILVGYSDLKHFTGTFKKATSLNPGQYRKLYG